MPNEEFNFSPEGQAPGGWRLDRLEMANWGTFGEGHVHSLVTSGQWTLLVGENGSGKSTAIDALRTLLAPRSVLQNSFNDASGAQKKGTARSSPTSAGPGPHDGMTMTSRPRCASCAKRGFLLTCSPSFTMPGCKPVSPSRKSCG